MLNAVKRYFKRAIHRYSVQLYQAEKVTNGDKTVITTGDLVDEFFSDEAYTSILVKRKWAVEFGDNHVVVLVDRGRM